MTPSGCKQNVITSVSGKIFFQRDYLKKLSLISQMQEDQAQFIIMNSPGERGIRSVHPPPSLFCYGEGLNLLPNF